MALQELRKQLDEKEVSVAELTALYLKRIEETEDQLHSFITVTEDEAHKQAEHAQKEIDNGNAGPLTGIPYAAKDVFCTKGIVTTAASNILKNYIPPYSATAIEKAGDSVLLGKTNLDEFAMGSSTEHSAFGFTHNPYDLERVSGGSSGGSASVVAAGQAPWAFGTDTCGSIRLPAAFCNVVGFKPTYGRISRYGVISMTSSLDTVGFLTQTVADSAYLLQHMAGPDGFDSTAPSVVVDDYLSYIQKDAPLKGMKIGVPKEYLEMEGLSSDMRAVYDSALKTLEEQGANIIPISLPHTKYALATYYIICPSEVSSNLARYDGIQYGEPAKDAQTLDEVFFKTRERGFGTEVKRRIMTGTYCLSAGHVASYYGHAQKMRTLVTQDFHTAFEQVDVILSPSTPSPAFKFGECSQDPVLMYLQDIYAAPSSLAGVPAVSVPAGTINDLPAAVQFIAPHFQEGVMIQAAHAFEQTHTFEPPKLAI